MPWPPDSELTEHETRFRDLLDRFAYRDAKASEVQEVIEDLPDNKIAEEVIAYLLEKRQALLDEVYEAALNLTPRS